MAAQFIAAGALASNATVPTQAIAQPTCQVGDLLIAFVINKALNNVISPPDGTWTQIYQAAADCTLVADDHRAAIFWKIATATTGNHTFTKATDDNVVFGGVIAAFRGFDTVTPIDGPVAQITTAAADAVVFPAFDPALAGTHVVYAAFYGNDLTTFAAAMSNDVNPDCTKIIDLETATGTDFTIAVTSGDSDGANITARNWSSASTTDAGSTGVVFGIRPAAGSPSSSVSPSVSASTSPSPSPSVSPSASVSSSPSASISLSASPSSSSSGSVSASLSPSSSASRSQSPSASVSSSASSSTSQSVSPSSSTSPSVSPSGSVSASISPSSSISFSPSASLSPSASESESESPSSSTSPSPSPAPPTYYLLLPKGADIFLQPADPPEGRVFIFNGLQWLEIDVSNQQLLAQMETVIIEVGGLEEI